MTLTTSDYSRLEYLLGKERVQHDLTSSEEDELRLLLVQESPHMRDAELERLVRFGLLLVGARALLRALMGRPPG